VPIDSAAAGNLTNLDILSSDERTRVSEFQIEAPRRQFALARMALRTLLGQYLDIPPQTIEFDLGANGKPRLRGKHAVDLRFNVSHSGDLALIAVTIECEVGVDVEQVHKVGHLEQMARRFLHPQEAEGVLAIEATGRDEAFLKCWTGKEAVLKAVASGVAGSLKEFCVPIDNPVGAWISLPGDKYGPESRCWLRQVAPGEGYVASVATLKVQRRVVCSGWSAQLRAPH
jgi:4'-phosphopantetheinyl transferase